MHILGVYLDVISCEQIWHQIINPLPSGPTWVERNDKIRLIYVILRKITSEVKIYVF